jgi:hypothetical protein
VGIALDGPVYAADGYAALRAQDSNSDGVVNSLDANFNQLRVWRDLNQDGISQAGELQTLSQAGIASIGVTGTATNTNLGNGNTQVASGSFTHTNGSTGQSALLGVGFDSLGTLRQWMVALPAGSALRATLTEMDVYDAAPASRKRCKYHHYLTSITLRCVAKTQENIRAQGQHISMPKAAGPEAVYRPGRSVVSGANERFEPRLQWYICTIARITKLRQDE